MKWNCTIFSFSFICISWRLITLQYCSGFCHTLTWVSHVFTCVPHSEPPSHLPPMDVTILFCYIKSGSCLCAWDENQNIQSFLSLLFPSFKVDNLLPFNWAHNSHLTIPDGAVNACVLWMELKHVSVEGRCVSITEMKFSGGLGGPLSKMESVPRDVSAHGWEYTIKVSYSDDI